MNRKPLDAVNSNHRLIIYPYVNQRRKGFEMRQMKVVDLLEKKKRNVEQKIQCKKLT